MTTVTTHAHHTPDELLHLDGLFELVGGELVEKQLSFLAGKAAIRIILSLETWLQRNPVGDLVSEVTFRCFPDDPDLIRRPDVAFVAADRAATIPPEGHVRIAPDLAIEVISPTNTINVFEEKLSDYRSADVKLVWEVNPTLRYVRIHRPNRTTLLLEEDEILSGEGVLPGFSVKVAELLPAP